MARSPEDAGATVDLRRSLDLDDEPLVQRPGGRPSAPTSVPVPAHTPNQPAQALPAAPPPLPPRRSAGRGSSGTAPVPSVGPLPAAGLHPAAQVPQAFPRPGGDPFGEPPEPRHSRGVAMDEKLEFFRTVVKQKEETLARARALYEQRDLESARLREVATALYAQVEEVLPLYGRLRELPSQLEQLSAGLEAERNRAQVAEASLKATDADRRDLARALAEVEAELPGLRSSLDEERQSRAMLAEELVGVKESQGEAEARLAEARAEAYRREIGLR